MNNDGFGPDRYGADVLAAGWRDAGRRAVPRVAAAPDLVVEIAGDGFCGAVTGIQSGHVELEDRRGRRRLFPLGGGFLIDGQAVTDSQIGLGERLGAVALGTAQTVGSAASIVVSTPIAVFDPVTRKNYDDQWRRLGNSVEDTTTTAVGQ